MWKTVFLLTLVFLALPVIVTWKNPDPQSVHTTASLVLLPVELSQRAVATCLPRPESLHSVTSAFMVRVPGQLSSQLSPGWSHFSWLLTSSSHCSLSFSADPVSPLQEGETTQFSYRT